MLGAGGGPGGAGTGASVPAGGKTQTQALKTHFFPFSILLCSGGQTVISTSQGLETLLTVPFKNFTVIF